MHTIVVKLLSFSIAHSELENKSFSSPLYRERESEPIIFVFYFLSVTINYFSFNLCRNKVLHSCCPKIVQLTSLSKFNLEVPFVHRSVE